MLWQSKQTNNGKIPRPIRSKRERLLELFWRNIKRISLNKNEFIHGKKRHKVNIVGGPRCIKNKSRKTKREEEEKKATEKVLTTLQTTQYLSQYIRGWKLAWHRHRVFPECGQR